MGTSPIGSDCCDIHTSLPCQLAATLPMMGLAIVVPSLTAVGQGRRPALGRADANYSTKLRRIKNECSYNSSGRHWLHLDAPGVPASNTSASAALQSSNQFSLRSLIAGNKRQLGLCSRRNSLPRPFRQYSNIMSSSCMSSSSLLDTLPICRPRIHGASKANCRP